MVEFDCVTLFVACYTDWDIKVAVKFVARSHDILIHTLRKWENLALVYSLFSLHVMNKIFDLRAFIW